MGAAVASDSDEPMMDINTTPLIDVMLVLLIMFIITIPPQTHAVKIDLPVPTDAPPPPVDPQRNKVFIEQNGTVLWVAGSNPAVPIGDAQLQAQLEATTNMDPIPELQVEPHPEAPFEVVDRILAVIKRAKVEAMGFIGNDRYQQF
jgi:biopolymer transport protein ExbD